MKYFKMLFIFLASFAPLCAQVPTDGLVAWYPFTNGSLHDSSENGNDGTNYGAMPDTDRFRNPNCAYTFNGLNNYIDLDTAGISSNPSAITQAAWIKTNTTGRGPILTKRVLDTDDWPTVITWDTHAASWVDYPNHHVTPFVGTSVVTDGKWRFVVATKNSGVFKIYVDGLLEIEGTDNYTTLGSVSHMQVGRRPPWNEWFNGVIDDIRIFNRALSEVEIQALYHEGGWVGNPSITVNSPNGGENWVVGTQKTITWDATAIDNVKIELIRNDGFLYTDVITESAPASTGTYSFTVPPYFSRTCIIKISDASSASVYDTSDARFSIIHTPVIIVPGVMGSPLYNDIHPGDINHLIESERIWVDQGKYFNLDGNAFLDVLQLDANGSGPLDPNNNIQVYPIPGDLQNPFNADQLNLLPLQTYSGLIANLTSIKNYKLDNYDFSHNEGEDLFLFTYDWRKSNNENALRLAQFIRDVTDHWTGSEKVNVIVHSMGGIITKQSIQVDETIKSKIKKLFFIGTPHFGSPEIQYVRLTGDLDMGGYLIINGIQTPIKNNVVYDRGEIIKIGRNMPSTYELFPFKDYFNFEPKALYDHVIKLNGKKLNYDKSMDYFDRVHIITRNGLNFIDVDFNHKLLAENTNPFQEGIKNVDLSGIEVINIVGFNSPTIGEIDINKKGECAGKKNLNGDQSVPLRSAEMVNSSIMTGDYYIDGIIHVELPSSLPVIKIINAILDDDPNSIQDPQITTTPPKNAGMSHIQATAACPVIMDAYDTEGRHTGPTSDSTWVTNIPGSRYYPANLNDPNSKKIILLPRGNKYQLVINSQDTTASFDFQIDDIKDGYDIRSVAYDSIEILPNTSAVCSLKTITGSLKLYIDKNGDGTVDTIVTPEDYSSLSKKIDIHTSWNLVSIPVKVDDGYKNTLFPNSISNAFSYNGSYTSEETLKNGIGYWLKFPYPERLEIVGIPAQVETIQVNEGWNIIGSISDTIVVTSIASDPPGMVTSDFFRYAGSYLTSASIEPGQGYWVKVNQACKLILSANPSQLMLQKSAIRIVSTNELPPQPPEKEVIIPPTIPMQYALNQNYPNPFNPVTIMKYQMPVDSKVSLKIFNTLGQVVAILTDGMEQAGYRQIDWNASSVPSGVYFYRLDATSVSDPSRTFTQVKKMILLR